MSDTRMLLQKITALRQRLDQVQGLASEARSAAASLVAEVPAIESDLVQDVETGSEHDLALDAALRPLTGAHGEDGQPRQLTARARRVLERGRELLGQLRPLAETLAPSPPGSTALLGPAEALTPLYRDTVAMIDTALRTVALLPDSTSAQMHLCRGLEVTLEEVTARLRTLTAGNKRIRQQEGQIVHLAGMLMALDAGQTVDMALFRGLADEVLAEVRQCEPLRFLEADPFDAARFIASHSLTTARVLARVVHLDPDLRNRAQDAVLAALLHDVGMLGVPSEVLAHPGALESEQMRTIETHCVVGSQQVAAQLPDAHWIAEAIASHHERLDGTGYPDGLKGVNIPPLSRLLAVCDLYAAFCLPRPYRPARSTRTALADILLMAEQGQLDHHFAECLLSLSFYPVGSVVELANGAIGVVVATPSVHVDLNSPARPVVALLTDGQGEPLPRPHHLNLAQTDSHSIVRLLPAAERRELFGRRFPQWAA